MDWITFGTHRSQNEWDLQLTHFNASLPSIKTNKIEVAGRDGALDLTEYFGEVKYNNRELEISFIKQTSPQEFAELVSQIGGALHGQEYDITYSQDNNYYYRGRCEIKDAKLERGIAHITITAEAEPYKLKQSITRRAFTISGTQTIILNNDRKRTVPTITASAPMVYTYKGNTYSASAGTYVIPEIILEEGTNTITITGTGSVSFEYREGRL